MRPIRRAGDAEALSRYREALVAGAPETELDRLAEGLDPDLVATVRWSMMRARQVRPHPDPVFVRDLRRELVQAATVSGVTPPALHPGPREVPPTPPERAHSAPPTPVMRPSWDWRQLIAAAAVLLLLASGVVVVRNSATERPPTVFVAPGAPETVTFIDDIVEGAPAGYTPLTLERWSFQPEGMLTIPALDGPQWVVAETGMVVATVDGEERSLPLGQSLVLPAEQVLTLRNPGLTTVAVLRGVANAGFALEEYDRAAVSKANALSTEAHPSLPPGLSRIVFDRLTVPPGTKVWADAATGQDWFQIDGGVLGLTLAGDALPQGWTSNQERELVAGEVVPRLAPGTRLTMRSIGEDALVLLRLRVESPTGGDAATTTPLHASKTG